MQLYIKKSFVLLIDWTFFQLGLVSCEVAIRTMVLNQVFFFFFKYTFWPFGWLVEEGTTNFSNGRLDLKNKRRKCTSNQSVTTVRLKYMNDLCLVWLLLGQVTSGSIYRFGILFYAVTIRCAIYHTSGICSPASKRLLHSWCFSCTHSVHCLEQPKQHTDSLW